MAGTSQGARKAALTKGLQSGILPEEKDYGQNPYSKVHIPFSENNEEEVPRKIPARTITKSGNPQDNVPRITKSGTTYEGSLMKELRDDIHEFYTKTQSYDKVLSELKIKSDESEEPNQKQQYITSMEKLKLKHGIAERRLKQAVREYRKLRQRGEQESQRSKWLLENVAKMSLVESLIARENALSDKDMKAKLLQNFKRETGTSLGFEDWYNDYMKMFKKATKQEKLDAIYNDKKKAQASGTSVGAVKAWKKRKRGGGKDDKSRNPKVGGVDITDVNKRLAKQGFTPMKKIKGKDHIDGNWVHKNIPKILKSKFVKKELGRLSYPDMDDMDGQEWEAFADDELAAADIIIGAVSRVTGIDDDDFLETEILDEVITIDEVGTSTTDSHARDALIQYGKMVSNDDDD